MKKQIFILTITLFAFVSCMGDAKAYFTTSTVDYTSNTVSFDINGSMAGYGGPFSASSNAAFSIEYRGDVWAGTSSTFTQNTWDTNVFNK